MEFFSTSKQSVAKLKSDVVLGKSKQSVANEGGHASMSAGSSSAAEPSGGSGLLSGELSASRPPKRRTAPRSRTIPIPCEEQESGAKSEQIEPERGALSKQIETIVAQLGEHLRSKFGVMCRARTGPKSKKKHDGVICNPIGVPHRILEGSQWFTKYRSANTAGREFSCHLVRWKKDMSYTAVHTQLVEPSSMVPSSELPSSEFEFPSSEFLSSEFGFASSEVPSSVVPSSTVPSSVSSDLMCRSGSFGERLDSDNVQPRGEIGTGRSYLPNLTKRRLNGRSRRMLIRRRR